MVSLVLPAAQQRTGPEKRRPSSAREVAGHLVPAGALGLADPVRRHEAALAVGPAGAEEFEVLLVEASAERACIWVEEIEAPS